jgi:hypothetical protein
MNPISSVLDWPIFQRFPGSVFKAAIESPGFWTIGLAVVAGMFIYRAMK